MAIGDIKAGKAYVEIATDNAKLHKGLAAAQQTVKGFAGGIGSAVNSVGAFVAGITAAVAAVSFLTKGIAGAVERASQFVDLADRLDADVEGLQGLSFAAGRLGVEIDTVNTSIKKLQKGLGEGTIAKELQQIGLSAEDFAGVKADEAFLRVVDALRSVSDQNEQAALTAKLFGRSGQDLQGIIKEGSESLRQMASEGKALGVIMEEDLARGFEHAGDAAEDATKAVEGLFNQKFFQERLGAYSDLLSEIVTLGDAQTEFFNSTELKVARYNARQKQAAVDEANLAKAAEGRAEVAKQQASHVEGTLSMMEQELAIMEAMVAPAEKLIAAEERREDLRKEGRRIFEMTRTPQEQYAAELKKLREISAIGGIDQDTRWRRTKQLFADLQKQLEVPSAKATSAGTFNPFAARGLSDNERLTKAAEQTEKNTRKIADKMNQGLVFH